MKILIFSWNTESVGIYESLDDSTISSNRENSSFTGISLPSLWYNASLPDFFPSLKNKILENDIDILVIGFQEDRYPGSYFHSHFLPEYMSQMNYTLVKRSKLMGIGVTTFKGLMYGDLLTRGIRVSIYAKSDLAQQIKDQEAKSSYHIDHKEYLCSSFLTRSKGALASYLILPNGERVAIICCHLPFNAQSLIAEREHNNKMLRQNELNTSNTCFNNIIENLVLNSTGKIDKVIYFGDFNYRIDPLISAQEIALSLYNADTTYLQKIYTSYDELKQQTDRENIYRFEEGINNQGPLFLPTCKLVKFRCEENSWKTGKVDQRIPSWTDRILYKSYTEQKIECIYYNRFEEGDTMRCSDHAGVLAILEI